MEKKDKSTWRILLELAEIVVIAFAISWIVRTYVIEARVIPSGSMLETIQLQDRIIVDKFFFNHFDKIHRGDIVVFRPPDSAHATEDYIKRVIGLPGDKIEIRNHKTYINGQYYPEDYVTDPAKSDFAPVVVPQDSVFVMGDNRNNSADSREWGWLPVENITGRALFRYWPFSHFGLLKS